MRKILTALAAISLAALLSAPVAFAATESVRAESKKETVAAEKAKAPAKAAAVKAKGKAKGAKVAKPAKPASKKAPAKPAAKKQAKPGKTAKKASKPLPKSDWSPNNFPAGNRGWCTWYVDGRYYKYFGEKLELAPRPGSNAHLWYPRAQKLKKDGYGEAGDIMVMKRPRGDRTGHVAFVEEVIDGVGWVVTQSNFDFKGHKPLRVDYIDGRKVTTDLFVPGPRAGTIRLDGGNSVYNLVGFLHRDDNPLLALAGQDGPKKTGIGGDAVILTEAQLEIAASAVAETEELAALEAERLAAASFASNTEARVVDEEMCGCSIVPRLTL